MQKAVVLLLALVVAASAFVPDAALEGHFQEWRVRHGKFYETKQDYARRLSIFGMNKRLVEIHNAGNHTFTVGLNQFADMTNAEYRAIMLPHREEVALLEEESAPASVNAPDSWDWRDHGAVNEIKDQGQCGSCYAFGGAASMEAAYKIGAGKLVSISEQNLIDCSWSQGNQGCNGGWHHWVMQYVINNKGVDGTADYPYKAVSSHDCKYDASKSVATISSYTQTKTNEAALMEAVQKTVVGIAIDASHWSFQMYKNGVYNEAACSSTSLDHAVAAVGWATTDANVPYWIVRNSWGKGWGQAGYIWMTRNGKNQCGVATRAYYATY